MSTHSHTRSKRRAQSLPPEERRASIVVAALPLVIARGREVTTAHIARAAGIAEGTVFSAFPSKEAILDACVQEVTRTDGVHADLAAAARHATVDERLLGVADALDAQFRRALPVVLALGLPGADRGEVRDGMLATLVDDVAEFVAREVEIGEIVGDATLAARALAGLMFAVVFQHVHAGIEPPSTRDLVSVVLDGVRRPQRSGS
ncbi:MAG: TetR/AcrR family transcriptional regulator [Acidobacteria bacterium]|nr:TetR/AcrR family transcriptional regulator [Acidobacteriota bacterium]